MASASEMPAEGTSVDKTADDKPGNEANDTQESKLEGATPAPTNKNGPVKTIITASGHTIYKIGDLADPEDLEQIDFFVIFKKEKHEVKFPLDYTVGKLKTLIEKLTGLPGSLQKIMYKGLAKDSSTLRDMKFVNGCKVMVVGSTFNDVLSMSTHALKQAQEERSAPKALKEPLSEQKQHKKVLDKYGKPDDVPIGIKAMSESLPSTPLSGMYNKAGGKVRLTFKLEADQLWIGTKERTDKIPMQSIKAVVSEPIKDNEDYHIMGIQLGPTEASRYWIYWVPAQYVEAVKEAILGKWHFF